MKKSLCWLAAGAVLTAVGVQAEETVVPRFDLKEIVLEGNSILPPAEVAAILARFTGPQKDFGTLQEAMESLEAAYRKRGYNLTTVILPEQELQQGRVRLTALEPKVKEIKIEGNSHFSRDNILATLPTLHVGRPPHVTALSENLRAANENPGKKITLQFKTPDNPEDLQALVQVKDQKPWKVALTGDNTGTDKSGYYRMGLLLQHYNLWNLDHVASLQYVTSPDHADKVKIVSGSYRLPIYRLGDTVDIFGGYSDVDNGEVMSGVTFGGQGTVTGIRYNLSLPRVGGYEQKFVLGMDYRFYDNTIKQGTTSWNQLAPDYVIHPFSVTYGGTWTSDQATLDLYLGVVHNEPWGGQGTRDYFKTAFANARPDPAVDFTIVRYGFSDLLRPGSDWLIRVAGNGQFTPDRLVPGEQFGLGGATSIRGYEEREEAYDAGFVGNLELYSPDLAPLFGLPKTQFRLLGFFDGGTGFDVGVKANETERSNSLMGAGGGFRLGLGDFFSFSLDWGCALKEAANTRKGSNMVHFKGQISF